MIDAPRRNGSVDANPVAVQTNPIFSQWIIGTRQNFGSDPFALFRHLTLDRFRYRPDRVDLHLGYGGVAGRSLSSGAARCHGVNGNDRTLFKEKQQTLRHANQDSICDAIGYHMAIIHPNRGSRPQMRAGLETVGPGKYGRLHPEPRAEGYE